VGVADLLKGKWLKHPLHPIVVHVPVALWPGALVFDLLSRFGDGSNALVRLAFFAIAFGLAATLLAIPTGVADWSEIKQEKPAWKIGLYHMAANLVVTILFAINFGLRLDTFQTAEKIGNVPLLLSAIGTLLVFVSAYLGGRMVYAHGIGVARTSKTKWRKLAQAGNANVPPEK
jgi:uncharacterized membrane protein